MRITVNREMTKKLTVSRQKCKKKPRRRRRGQRGLKMSLYFTYESRGTLRLFTLFITVKNINRERAKIFDG